MNKIKPLQGKRLAAQAALLGVHKKPGESDRALRRRCVAKIRDVEMESLLPYLLTPTEIP